MLSDTARRVAIEWRMKTAISVVLPIYFCVLYFGIQRLPMLEPRSLAPTVADDLIAFEPRWTAVYQSLYLFLPLPWLCTSAAELRRYISGFFAVTAVAFLCFVLFPVEGPRPATALDDALYKLVVTYDRNVNTVPSLHVALTVYTLLLAFRIARSGAARLFATTWALLIVFSTMAIKQHWAVDVAAGVALAIAADLWSRLVVQNERTNTNATTPAWIDPPSPGDHHSAGRSR